MGIRFIEQFLHKNFSKLPPWARTVVYFSMLAVFFLLILKPIYIHGDIQIEDGEAFIPFSIGKIQYTFEGKTITTFTDDNGAWSIPLVPKFFTSLKLKFSIAGAPGRIVEIDVDYAVQDLLYARNRRILFDPDSRIFRLASLDSGPQRIAEFFADGFRAVAGLFSARVVHAQQTSEDIREGIYDILVNDFGVSRDKLDPEAHFIFRLRLGIISLLRLKAKIQDKFNIQIAADEWGYATAVRPMVELIRQKQAIRTR